MPYSSKANQNNSSSEEGGSSASGSQCSVSPSLSATFEGEYWMADSYYNSELQQIYKYQRSSWKRKGKLIWDGLRELYGWDTVNKKYRDLSAVTNEICTLADGTTTVQRTVQVYDEVWTTYNPSAHSVYNDIMYTHGPGSALTPAGWSVMSIGLATIPLAVVIGTAKKAIELHSRSLDYHQRRLKDQLGYKFVSDEEFEKNIDESFKDLLRRRKVVNKTNEEAARFNTDANETYVQAAYKANDTLRAMQAVFDGSFAPCEQNGFADLFHCKYTLDLPGKRHWSLRFLSGVSLFLKRFWQIGAITSLIYWIVWMPFDSALGAASACTSALFAPIVIGITGLFTLPYIIPKLYHMIKNAGKTKEEREQAAAKAAQEAEYQRMGSQLRLRDFMSKEKLINQAYLRKLLDGKADKAVDDESIQNLLELKRKKNLNKKVENKQQYILYRTKEEVQKSRLVKSLLRGSKFHIYTSSFVEAFSTNNILSFIVWFGSSLDHAFQQKTTKFNKFMDGREFDNGVIMGSIGIGAAIAAVFKNIMDKNLALIEFKKSIHKKMCEEYKNTKRTKLEVYEDYEREVELRKARVEWLRLNIIKQNMPATNPLYVKLHRITNASRFKALLASGKQDDNVTIEEYSDFYKFLRKERQHAEQSLRKSSSPAQISKLNTQLAARYDLKKIDVNNSNYFADQRYKKSNWGIAGDALGFIWDTILFAESNSLAARILFLCGGALFFMGAGAITVGTGGTALPVFFILAGLMIIAGTTIYHVNKRLTNKRAENEKFINGSGMEDKISYMQKKGKELGLMDAHLCSQLNAVNQPEIQPVMAPGSQDPVFGKKQACANDVVPRPGDLTNSGSPSPSLSGSSASDALNSIMQLDDVTQWKNERQPVLDKKHISFVGEKNKSAYARKDAGVGVRRFAIY